MEFKSVTVQASYPHPDFGTFAPLKLSAEVFLNENDTPEEAWTAAKEKMDNWNKELNKPFWTNPEGMTGTYTRNLNEPAKFDEDYSALLNELENIEFLEDAIEHIEKRGFKYNVQAKQIATLKPSKNK